MEEIVQEIKRFIAKSWSISDESKPFEESGSKNAFHALVKAIPGIEGFRSGVQVRK